MFSRDQWTLLPATIQVVKAEEEYQTSNWSFFRRKIRTIRRSNKLIEQIRVIKKAHNITRSNKTNWTNSCYNGFSYNCCVVAVLCNTNYISFQLRIICLCSCSGTYQQRFSCSKSIAYCILVFLYHLDRLWRWNFIHDMFHDQVRHVLISTPFKYLNLSHFNPFFRKFLLVNI
jgi:hypothetical protein